LIVVRGGVATRKARTESCSRSHATRAMQMATCATFGFDEPDQFAASARGARLGFLVTARGRYRADLTRINFDQLWVQRTRQSLPFVARASGDKSRHVVIFYETGRPSMQQTGMEISPGDLVVDAYGSEHYFRTETDSRNGSMSLTTDDLAEACITLTGHEPGPRHKTSMLRPAPHLTSRLMHLHKVAGDLAVTAPEILTHPEAAKAIEQALIHALVMCLTDDGTDNDAVRSVAGSTTIMRRFEQFLESREGEPLYLAELCKAIGASERTLRMHCQNHVGMSPHRYLWLRRMHLVRRALTLADPSITTVTNVANDFGFAELGRFAVAYRSLFSESPSMTLRRPPVAIRTPSGRPRELVSVFA
jgi:AraC-like DNA-binding protein